jgi:DNA polymerase III subunit gamma/tau
MKGKQNGQALYRKYRSRSLDEVVGQSHVTGVLSRSLKQGKIAHAYLLTGPRGVGKTSIARILAHEINNLPYDSETTHLDIIEIDAASNNGVDDVRDLRDKVQIAPVSAAKKVYIIDEVHMLSKPAFNALLKTLEEPPEHIVFILATTDLHKVPATIISRTQHFAFRSISKPHLVEQLRKIANAEGIKISDDALDAIAERGDGSFRDSISLLDQLSSFADENDGITIELVEETLGLAQSAAVSSLIDKIAARDIAGIISGLNTLEQAGVQPVTLADQLIKDVRGRLAEKPVLVTLMDALLDVAGSQQPQLKLLTVLVGAVKPKQTTAALAAAPALVIEAPVAQLPKVSPKSRPSEPKSPESAQNKQHGSAPVATPMPETPVAKRQPGEIITIDWSALVAETRENHVALHSVLSKCDYTLEGDTLTLYTGRKFGKTKLDDPKYLTKLHEALAAQGAHGLMIVTVPTAKPPADEKLAAIAAMMGGGQEVAIE